VSPATRFVAADRKATVPPSPEMSGCSEAAFGWDPSLATPTRPVVPASRSRTNASATPLVSPGTRFEATDTNATLRPLPEIDGAYEPPFAATPPTPTLTIVVVPSSMSRTNTSGCPLVSPATRSEASLWYATYRPSPETDGVGDAAPLGSPPIRLTLTSAVERPQRSRNQTCRLFWYWPAMISPRVTKATWLPSAEMTPPLLAPKEPIVCDSLSATEASVVS